MVVKRYTEDKKGEWNDFCKISKNGIFLYERDYMDYHKDRFNDFSLMMYEDDILVAILPASIKEDVVVSHGGLTFGGLVIGEKVKQHLVNTCFWEIIQFFKKEGVKELRYKQVPHIYHTQPAEEDSYALFLNNATIDKIEPSTVVDLSNSIKMPKGRKAQISRARREGVEIVELDKQVDFCSFIELENRVLKERHNTLAVHSGEELKMLRDYFPNNIHLHCALYKGELVAGAVVFEHKDVIHIQYMGANETARELGALDLTISTIMDIYRGKKRWLDFGISTEDGGRFLNEGLIAQKEGFGGRTNVYYTWTLSIQ